MREYANPDFIPRRLRGAFEGDVPSDAAIFAWAALDARVARRVNAAEDARIAVIQQVVGDDEVGGVRVSRVPRFPDAPASGAVVTRVLRDVCKDQRDGGEGVLATIGGVVTRPSSCALAPITVPSGLAGRPITRPISRPPVRRPLTFR